MFERLIIKQFKGKSMLLPLLNASRKDLRGNGKMGKTCGRLKRRKEIVSAPITLPQLDTATLVEPRQRTVAWEGALLGVIDLDPHEVGVSSANWTTELLAGYLGQHTGIQVTEEAVRVYCMPMDTSASDPPGSYDAKRESRRITWEKRAGRGLVSRGYSP